MLAVAWQLLQGTLLTVELLLCSLWCGLCLAVLLTALRMSERKYLQYPVHVYTFFIRGTPLLVQIFLIYYGFGQFAVIRESFLWPLLVHPFACAVLAFAVNTSAYSTELFCGVIKNISAHDVEVGKALGMSRWMIMKVIIIPQAIRRVLPAYSNEVVIILKSTSLASTITLLDILGIAQQYIAETYATLKFLLIAGAIYLLLNALIMQLFRMLERRIAGQQAIELPLLAG